MKKLKSLIASIKRTNKIKPSGKLDPYGVLLEAGQGKNINGNMFALLKAIEYDKQWQAYTPYFVVTKNTLGKAKERCSFYKFKKVKFVIRDTKNYWKLLNSCKYVMTDNSFPPLYQKQPGQVYLNTWHGTPLKYLGRSDIKNATSLGNIQKNYFMCDYALFPNEHTRDVFMKDYMLERVYEGKNVLADYPRNGVLLDKEASQQRRQALGLQDKKVFAYMPTWRGSNRKADSEGQVEIIKKKLNYIDECLSDKEVLYVNLHFLVSSALEFSEFKHILPFPSEYETYDFLAVCDGLITDYSSVFFDFANTDKKIILYAYDKEDYLRDKGMYLDMDTFPFPIVQTEDELLKEIHSDEIQCRQEFQNMYCKYRDEHIATKVLDLVINGNQTALNVESVQKSGRKHCVFHVGHLGNHLSRNIVLELLENIDTKEVDVTLCFEGGITPSKVAFLQELPKDVYYYSLLKSDGAYFYERLQMALFVRFGFFKKSCHAYLQREKTRNFYKWQVDEVHFVFFQKVKYAYMYGLFKTKKVFHDIPKKTLGHKIFKPWFVALQNNYATYYDECERYKKDAFDRLMSEAESYDASVRFQVTKMSTTQIDEGISLKLSCKASSYDEVDFSKLQLKIGNRVYTPTIKHNQPSKNAYYTWDIETSLYLPYEDSKGQELQNKMVFLTPDEQNKYRITYGFIWKRMNALKPLKLFIDEHRGLTYFFRYPNDTLTLTIRDKNVTDQPLERKKVVLAYLLSKVAFFYKPVLLFEKNAARYEESASVVYEALLDRGYKNVYFVLDKNYPFKDSVPPKYRSNIIDKYSFKHYFIFFSAKSLIGSESKIHAFELRPISKLVTSKLNRSKHNYVFLQHGVMYMISLDAGRRAFFKKSKNKKVRQRTIVSSQLELEHFTKFGGYKETDLYLCGLPKFDRNTLNPNPSKIVVMITWRPWEFIQSLDNIEETSYFKMLVKIVEHIPEQYKEHLVVLPHPLVEGQMRSTSNALQPYIPEVVKYDDLLKDTKILITDYSSISYDAFYRGCNVIFCWQEKEECLVEYGANAKLMLTKELAFGDVNEDYEELESLVTYNYTHPQQKQHLENYQQVVNFKDGKNTERLIELLERDHMV